jgi:carbonic anhydrase
MSDDTRDRRSFLRIAGAAVAGLTMAGRATAARPKTQPTPDQALRKLAAGNARFVAGKLHGANAIAEQRAHVAGGQQPFAMVLTCADSRVPPELVFDQGLGDLFVCRVAGNVFEPAILGSFEYAVEHFGTPLLVVLGHQRCGAVSAAVEVTRAGGKAPGHIQRLVAAIRPAIRATKKGSLSEEDYVEAVVRTNAKLVARSAVRTSRILGHAARSGKLRVVAARYSLESGRVTFFS